MKILLLGDASNYHSTLAKGLQRLGHDVTVASDGSRWMDTRRDIDLSRKPGKIGGAIFWLKLNTVLSSAMKGYDVVQLVNPIFIPQRPGRVADFFRKLKRTNGAVFLTALGTDLSYVETCLASDSPLRYSEWAVDGRRTAFADSPQGLRHRSWLSEPLRSHSLMIYDNVDGVVSALYEYHLAMGRYVPAERLAYGGIPVDVDNIPFAGDTDPSRKPIVLAPYHRGRMGEKGTDILFKTASRADGIDLRPVTGLKFNDFVSQIAGADVVLDQLYSYTPATTALLAMAMGKTVVTGAEPEYGRFVGTQVPAFNADPRHPEGIRDFLNVYAAAYRDNPVPELFRHVPGGRAARDFVRRYNDTLAVARRFVDFWQRLV